MRILFLAPQPFFQERGTPIAVRLALKVLARTNSYKIDLLTFREGQDLFIENVKAQRIWSPAFLNGVGPGFSFKKLFCDAIFFVDALCRIIGSIRQGRKYHLIHAVEESVFMAMFFKFFFRIPYIYDMDSCLALQLTEKLPFLKPISFLLEILESQAIKNSLAVIPVCDALAVIAQNRKAEHVELLPDISLASEEINRTELGSIDLRKELELPEDSKILLYVGNLESYQGVELLVNSFSKIAGIVREWRLVIIGGRQKHISELQQRILQFDCADQIILAGPRSVSRLDAYLKQANMLASPRILGNNTPMKIYSYMHSGVPIIATNLPTHTQVLNSEMCYLVEPEEQAFADGLKSLIEDSGLQARIAKRAYQEVEDKYTFDVFSKNLVGIYQRVAERLTL